MTDKDLPPKKLIRRIRLHDRNDEVGYRKPPKKHQFKPGHSGNPSGRPRRKKTLVTLTQEMLDRVISVTEGGKVKRISMKDALLRRLLDHALKGNLKSANFLFNLYQAPTEQSVDDLNETDQAILQAYADQLKADLIMEDRDGRREDDD